ncbi:MAG: hypothetical protein IJV60_08565 [Prevotella sp.]|nr:hypothetical protein [Prevotella sp.]MBQ8114625.1 hypothetical protein [Prevotella sp.]
MKKQLLTLVALLFAAVTAMAQVSLGTPKWNIKDGAKISLTKDIQLSFPEATGVTAESVVTIAGNLFPADEEQGAEPDFDGLESSIANPVSIVMADILDEVQEKTTYNLIITSVQVDNVEQLTDGETISISFTTRGGERKLSWKFDENLSADETKMIDSLITAETNVPGSTYPVWKASSQGRYQCTTKLQDEELTFCDGIVVPMTEGLYFTTAGELIVPGSATTRAANKKLHLAQSNTMIIPDCKAGDKISFDIMYVVSGGTLEIPGATCTSASDDDKHIVTAPKNRGTYEYVVTEDGDLTVKVNKTGIFAITIIEKTDFNPKYSVEANDPQGNVIKKYVDNEEVEAGNVDVYYSHWLKTAEDSLVVYGSVGTEMKKTFAVISDSTFVLQYKSTGIGGVVYLAEMEDLVNAEDLECPVQLLTTGNEAVRASKGKAAYVTSDYTITTVPAGTYKIYAGVFDKTKGGGSNQTFKVGEEEIIISSTSDNLSIVESSPFTVTEDTPVVWLSNGSNQNGVDMIAIYATEDVPEEEPDGVASVEAKTNAAKAVRKVVKDGQLLIEGANGTFNVAGAQVK